LAAKKIAATLGNTFKSRTTTATTPRYAFVPVVIANFAISVQYVEAPVAKSEALLFLNPRVIWNQFFANFLHKTLDIAF
jgi:hypothetical protein